MRATLLSLLLLLTGVALVPVPPASAATGIDDGVIELGTDPLQLAPDTANGRVWVRGKDRVEVADIGTGTARGIAAPVSRDLAVSTDGTRAYLATGTSIVEIDAESLATRTFDLGAGHCPSSLAATSAGVYYGDGCGGGGVLDPVTGGRSPSPFPNGSPHSVPGRDLVLFGLGGAEAVVLDATTSSVLARRELPYLDQTVPQVSSDGRYFLAYGSRTDPVYVRELDSLAPVGSLPTGSPESFVSTLDMIGGLVVVADGATSLYDLGTGDQVNQLLPDSPEFWRISTVTSLGALVVSGGRSQSGAGALFVETDPALAGPELSVERPDPVDAFTPTTVEGRLTDDGEPVAGETVLVTDGHGEPIATVPTGPDGRFATEVVFPGHTTVVVRWAGGDGRPAAVAYTSATVPATDVQVTASAPATVAPTEPVPLEIHLQSANGSDAGGMTIDVYRRCDHIGGWGQVGSAVTGSDGNATWSEPAPPCLEAEYLVYHWATLYTRTTSFVTSVIVSWQSSTLELTTPDDVTVGDSASVRARLLVDGSPAPGRPVTLTAAGGEPVHLVTDAEGRVSAPVTFATGGAQQVKWDFAGEASVLPTWADTDVWVRRRATLLSADPSSAALSVTDPLTISGTLTDERGDPVPEAEVNVYAASGSGESALTDSDGSYAVELSTTRWDPAFRVELGTWQDDAHEATGAEVVVDVQPLPSSLTLTTDVPRVAVEDRVMVSGTLTRQGDDDLAGESVRVTRLDDQGTPTQLGHALLDASGDFTFADRPPVAGDVTYVVTRARDDLYGRVRAEAAVEVVAPAPVSLTLGTDRRSYGAGDTADVTVAADSAAEVEVVLRARQADGTRTVLYRGPVDDAGVTLRLVVTSTTTFVATVGETVDHAGASARVRRDVRLGTATSVPNAWDRRRGTWLVATGTRPRVLTSTTPAREDVCLRFRVQRRVGDDWRSDDLSRCRTTDRHGAASYRLPRGPGGSHWRVRPDFAGDRRNAPTTGDWVEITIRSAS